ncbi:MAG: hypothetical protein RL641_695 [Candidatus Parcubacteria bacterium]|jgi:glycosyltransferase involved in cell wall biosynthesis
MSKPKVIGIILAYKHAQFLEGLYAKLPLDVLDEVIITNDESGDGIEKIAERLGVPCYSHDRLGYGGNIKSGVKIAMELGADYMVEIHGDGQFDTAFIATAVAKMNEGYDCVLGTRFGDMKQPLRDKMPMAKYLANISLTFIECLVLGVRVGEFHTGARVYSRKVFEKIDVSRTSNGFLFGFEILALIAYYRLKMGEVPVRAYYGQAHTSINYKSSIKYAIQTFGVLFQYIVARIGIHTRLFR